jgi:hypothetical protein
MLGKLRQLLGLLDDEGCEENFLNPTEVFQFFK